MTKRNVRSTMKAAALVLLLCLLALVQVCGAMAEELIVPDTVSKVVDPSTVDSWNDFFGPDKYTTEFAGKVWTDKSVFATAESAVNEDGDYLLPVKLDEDDEIILDDNKAILDYELEGDDSFIVALSAMAANKSIEGFQYTPTDTVLVLDMSNSMQNDVQELCNATNLALTRLLALNNNNRVGIVIYSGNTNVDKTGKKVPSWNDTGVSRTTILMTLDRYTLQDAESKKVTETIGTGSNATTVEYYEYLKTSKPSNNSKPNTILVNDGVYDSDGDKFSNSRNRSSGTWIQDGIYTAMTELIQADIVVPNEENNPQAGARRMPIIVLMTDGNPTLVTENYHGATGTGVINMTKPDSTTTKEIRASLGQNNGSLSDISGEKMAFLTQLTAAYTREQVTQHYGRAPMFYTLGFNIQVGSTEYRVMNPVTTSQNSTLAGYWRTYLNNGTIHIDDGVSVSGKDADVNGYNYVDEYFSANSSGLIAAFNDIVEKIVIQSLYYPTDAESGMHDLGGYVEFLDDIGEFMEVKDIIGVRLGGEMFDGHQFASKLYQMSQVDIANPEKDDAKELAALADEFVWSVQSRLGIENINEARNLINGAWIRREIAYDPDTGEYSNYIGWYADADRKYVPYNADGSAPAGAKYHIKSYGMIGPVNAGTYRSTDMMYVTIRVETELDTGHEQVIFKVPAALIPLYSYQVKLAQGDKEVTPGRNVSVTTEGSAQFPLRLLYEVGIRDDITPFNFDALLEKYKVEHGVAYPSDNNGSYYLYTNKWDQEQFDKNEHHLTQKNMVSWYEPSRENERFFYTTNTTIYVKYDDAYTPYAATNDKPSGDNYYRPFYYFEKEESNWTTKVAYEPIAAGTLDAAATNANSSYWYIPAGRVHRTVAGYRDDKKSNNTKTIAYADYPQVEYSSTDPEAAYFVDAILGNNGRLTIAKPTGLTISKSVDADDPNDGVFSIAISGGDISAGKTYYAQYSDSTEYVTLDATEDKLTLPLKPGQDVTVVGLTAGQTYTVTETLTTQQSQHWQVPKVTVDNKDANVTSGQGTYSFDVITQDKTVIDVDIHNNYQQTGTLLLTKAVTGAVPDDYNPDFTFVVTLDNANQSYPLKTSRADFEIAQSSVTDDSFEVNLKAGETIAIYGLNVDTQVSVAEKTPVATGFTAGTAVFTRGDKIKNDAAVHATITNAYAPVRQEFPTKIGINLQKTISGRDWDNKDSFSFELKRLLDTSGANAETVATLEGVTNGNSQRVLTGAIEMYLNKKDAADKYVYGPGSYVFHIHEHIPTDDDRRGGMTYDSQPAIITVTVAEVNGEIKITDVMAGDRSTVTGNAEDGWTINAHFVNTYVAKEADFSIPIVKNLLDADTKEDLTANANMSKAGYTFNLTTDENGYNVVTSAVSDESGKALLTVTGITTEQDREYYLMEAASGKPGVKDDNVKWKISVDVTDNHEGSLVATIEKIEKISGAGTANHPSNITPVSNLTKWAVPFYNEYDQNTVTVNIPILKTVNNIAGDKRGPEGFAFELVEGEDNVKATAVSAADGTATISYTFKEMDIGVHNWSLRERYDAEPNMVYSTEVYDVQIKVERAMDATTNQEYLVAKIFSQPEGFTYVFENIYGDPNSLNIPATGDNSKLMFFAGMLLAAGFVFLCRRNWTQN